MVTPVEQPTLFVASLALMCNKKIMLAYNAPWGAFTLPMTKLRPKEQWRDAAVRVAAEYTGKLFRKEPLAELGAPIVAREAVWPAPKGMIYTGDMRHGDRDGIEKVYLFHIFGISLDCEITPAGGYESMWLTAKEIQDDNLAPISASGRELVRRLMAVASDQGKSFPDGAIRWPYLRSSMGALAVIQRNHGGERQWLTQWNNKWDMYSLVGGHKEEDESFRECMARELWEELRLPDDGIAFKLPADAALSLEYDGWSKSAQVETTYTFEIFRVTLSDGSMKTVNASPQNRWVSEAEIRARRCKDGEPLSETIETVLDKMGWA